MSTTERSRNRAVRQACFTLAAAALMIPGGLALTSAAQPSPAGVYTAAQADAGATEYKDNCAPCHGEDLAGSEGPQLAGPEFVTSWKTQTTKDLFDYMQGMPPGGPALKADQYIKVLAYMLRENGASAGETELTDATAAMIGTIATGKRPGR